MKRTFFTFLLSLSLLPAAASGQRVNAPKPFGPTPTSRQLAWHDTQYYAFICLSSATYRDVEWGYGDMDPNEFQPTNFDPRQWVEVVKSAGMKGIVLTAKHHDGFCLWPSKLTDYSVAHSSWRNGQGDIVGELARECHKAGLKFGVYLSPWDRHDLRYGSPEYIDYYRGQLEELLTWYGPIFEVWQDGANGGNGYYGGLREQRRVDNRTYYQWALTDSLIRKLQPEACIFSDGGPDTRWCGNESGVAGDPNWAVLDVENYAPGAANPTGLKHGNPQGSKWVPAEVDVSIRPGWFWHESENEKVRSVENLMGIWYTSVGRGANLILSIPPTKEGLIHPIDSVRMADFGRALKREFSRPLRARNIKSVVGSNVRGGASRFGVKKALDGKALTYWATDDSVRQATLTFALRRPQRLYSLSLREPIQLGQRISKFRVEAQDVNGQWSTIGEGTTIGPQRLLRLGDTQAQALRVTVESNDACPLLREVQFYLRPE